MERSEAAPQRCVHAPILKIKIGGGQADEGNARGGQFLGNAGALARRQHREGASVAECHATLEAPRARGRREITAQRALAIQMLIEVHVYRGVELYGEVQQCVE